MKHNIQISVIIPIFNASQYLAECLDSIRAQEFSNFEVIMVDDGSTDDSANICQSYEQQDSRFRYMHQQNAGAGKARQKGVIAAQGKWITFVDADDLLPPTALRILHEATNDEVNIVIGQLQQFRKHVSIKLPPLTSKLISADKYREQMILGINAGPCAKLIRANLLEPNMFDIDSRINMGEDNIANINISFFNNMRIIQISSVVYFYRQHDASATHTIYQGIEYEQFFVETLFNAIPVHLREFYMPIFIERRINTLYYHFCRNSNFKDWIHSSFYKILQQDIIKAKYKRQHIERLLFTTQNKIGRSLLLFLKRAKDKLFSII